MRNYQYILFLGLLITTESFSCSCDSISIYDSFESEDYIFFGQIIKAEFIDFQDTLFGQVTQETDYKYTFRIDELIKGDSLEKIEIRTYYGSSCHFPLIHGEYYLIYAYKWKDHIRTGMCTRTKSWNDEKFSEEYKILQDLREKNLKNHYRNGLFLSSDNNSYFKFYNSGRFYYRNKSSEKIVHGQGRYIFNKDSLILDFLNPPTNKTNENYNIYPKQNDSINIQVQLFDYDLEFPIIDYSLRITDKFDSVIYDNRITKSQTTIKLEKSNMVDSLYFRKPGYPIFRTNFSEWDKRDLHVIEIEWQELFQPIEQQEIEYKIIDDKITEFKINETKYGLQHGVSHNKGR